jgi:cysteine-rich repeat protein
VSVCGNGVRDPNEQCDDANTTNLDGCDAACKFEQNQRVNYLEILFGTDAFCTANRLGGAIPSTIAQTTFQGTLTQSVANGTIDTFFKLTGLEDLTGATNDASLEVGGMNGAPVGTLPANGLDWWHIVAASSIDANRNPTAILPGNISGGILNAGPGTIVFAGFKASSAKLSIAIGASLAPLSSTGSPPGHLASEHLNPALVSFASTGQPNSAGAGKLCGDVSASSLAGLPIPSQITGSTCQQAFTSTNTLLDVLVSGCTNPFLGTLVQPTQPDRVDPAAPVAGAGGPYTLIANAQKTVATCLDTTGATVTPATCLNAAAYSSFFKFATQRVIVK